MLVGGIFELELVLPPADEISPSGRDETPSDCEGTPPPETKESEKMRQRLVLREVREWEVVLMLRMRVVLELEVVVGHREAKVWKELVVVVMYSANLAMP